MKPIDVKSITYFYFDKEDKKKDPKSEKFKIYYKR